MSMLPARLDDGNNRETANDATERGTTRGLGMERDAPLDCPFFSTR